MTKKYLAIIVILLALGSIFLVFNNNLTGNTIKTIKSNSDKTSEGITTSKIAKDFSLTTIEGNEIKLSDFRGNIVIFAFMATWCVPCQIEAENIKKVQDDNSFVVIQIDIDSREDEQDLIRFRKEFGDDNWIMAFDNEFEIAKSYNVRSFDTTIIVDQEGKIIYRDEGWPIDVKTLRDLFKGEFQQLVLGSVHEHATITVTIKDKTIDFSQPKYQLRSPFVHFEDNDGETIHVHANGVTLEYLFGTLGWDHKEPCLKIDLSEFCDGKLTIIVNGVERNLDYEPKEGDKIEVIYK